MITPIASALLLSLAVAEPAETPPVQSPSAQPEPAPQPEPDPTAIEATEVVEPDPNAITEFGPTPDREPIAAPQPEPTPQPDPEPELGPEPAPDDGEVLHVATERDGPPYYTDEDLAKVRAKHEVDYDDSEPPEAPRWRCLIADPQCRNTVELQAMGAYALRARQGSVTDGDVDRWHSARAQYDVWVGLPALVETAGKNRFTRISLGPKGGVALSDGGDLWGNVGIAMRYWLGRGRWAPNIEVTSALSFKLGSRVGSDVQEERFRMQRGPVGFSADVGFGIGGFGAIVIGGQYDSPLAREEVPEEYRVVSSGTFYLGFRGNILWGGPAAVAVGAHAATRGAKRP